ncbi:MAG: DinB family protein [Candidatus Thorarchaeota archaeon]
MTLLENMSRYLFWADSTIWNIVQTLTDEEYRKDLYDNGGSIQRRYAHLAQDLWEWYFDWIGKDHGEEPDFMDMSREEVFDSIKNYSKMFTDMIEDRTVNYLDIDTEKSQLRITFDEILFHLVNHATYHRGQIVMGLRILGKDVVMTDYVPHRIDLAESE